VLALNCSTELVDLGPRDVSVPSLALKGDGHASQAHLQQAVPVNAAVFRDLGCSDLDKAVGDKELTGKVLKLTRGEGEELVEQLGGNMEVVGLIESAEADLWRNRLRSELRAVFGDSLQALLSLLRNGPRATPGALHIACCYERLAGPLDTVNPLFLAVLER